MAKYLDYGEVIDLATSGAYATLASLDNETASVLLSGITMLQKRWVWESPQQPISDVDWNNLLNIIARAINQLMGSAIGVIQPFLTDGTLPDNVLQVDGSTYNRVDYPFLWDVLPASMKDATTFTLPDLTDSYLVGGSVAGGAVGSNQHTLSTTEMPAHTHSYTQTSAIPTAAGIEPTFADLTTQFPSVTGSAGGGLPHNNQPQSLIIIWGIVAQ